MSEKWKGFLKSLCVVLLQALAILAGLFVLLWLFGAFLIFGGLSWS